LEAALTLAHWQAVVRELVRRGQRPEAVLARLSFFLDAHSDFFEEVAKFRATRRMWASWVRDELGVREEAAQRFRFHTQTAGVTNTARHIHVNIGRSMVQAMAAVLGGTQSLHVDGYDEAVSIPTEHAALTALHSQLVLLHESGIAKTADPLGGSYLVEYLTDAIEERIQAVVGQISRLGGLVAATEQGWVHAELARTAFEYQKAVDAGEQKIVGVNCCTEGDEPPIEPFELPAHTLERQTRRLAETRSRRDAGGAQRALDEVGAAARSGQNVMPHVLRAVDADVTLGELGRTFRDSLGRWEFPLW
jgi:methylmalonyl-CoA mutase N-terminal domain/subunit